MNENEFTVTFVAVPKDGTCNGCVAEAFTDDLCDILPCTKSIKFKIKETK